MEELDQLGSELISACLSGDVSASRSLVLRGAPLWFQEPDSLWTPLHAAAHSNDLRLIEYLLLTGSPWNIVDACGLTAADISLTYNNAEAYTAIRAAGIRTEFVLGVLQQKNEEPNAIILKNNDDNVTGSTTAFLKSKLQYIADSNGQEICVATKDDGKPVGVMMGWEKKIMEETVYKLFRGREKGGHLRVLNIGFGLGLIDSIIQEQIAPNEHYIIEPHPDVLAHMRAKGWYEKPGVTIFEGTWQQVINSNELLIEGFDAIYIDTFSEEYSDLVAFFDHLPNLLRDSDAKFSFFNGLGATNATFYDVYTNIAELHLSEIGLSTVWNDVQIANEDGKDPWGNTIVYFSLPLYKLPICQMS